MARETSLFIRQEPPASQGELGKQEWQELFELVCEAGRVEDWPLVLSMWQGRERSLLASLREWREKRDGQGIEKKASGVAV